jgi:adenylate cyclase
MLSYAFLLRTSYQVGTGGGAYLHYLTAAVVGIIFLGTERVLLNAAITVMAAAAIIGLHLTVPFNTGLLSASSQFYGNFIVNVVATCIMLFAAVQYAITQIARAEALAAHEFERSESLLSNILPQRVADRLKGHEPAVIADAYSAASILFVDMAGFTSHASETTPAELVRFLNYVFTRLDDLVERHGLEKIKTTGDSYMVVSGVPEPRSDHAEALAGLALEIREELAGLVDSRGRPVPVRIGIASGPVVAGVVGTRKFFYDVWGDAVNVASRMESTGEPGKIQVAPETRELLKEHFDLAERGLVDVRGKGPMRTWFLLGRRPSGEA